ncbi:hypothetical protein ABH916_004195 [Peribacillus frigoritolerans]
MTSNESLVLKLIKEILSASGGRTSIPLLKGVRVK